MPCLYSQLHTTPLDNHMETVLPQLSLTFRIRAAKQTLQNKDSVVSLLGGKLTSENIKVPTMLSIDLNLCLLNLSSSLFLYSLA